MKKLYIVLLSCITSSSLIAQNFEEITRTPFDGVQYSSIAFADIDNDGDQDVLITGLNNSEQAISKLYTNDGNGIFTEVMDTPFENVGYSSIAFADIDSDGDQDVLITGYGGDIGDDIAKLYANDGNGNFTEALDTPFEGVSGSSIAFADIDNDNDQDVLITGSTGYPEYSNIAKLYTNDGDGIFEEVTGTPFVGVSSGSIAFADVDNDNDQDVLITGVIFCGVWCTSISKLYTNNGGIFKEVMDTTFENVGYSSIAFADVDNDNDLDVLITGSTTGFRGGNPITKLYTNDGNGNFLEVIDTHFKNVRYSSIAFADVDNDNDLDVLITGDPIRQRIAKLYTNDGSGIFTEAFGTPFDAVFRSSIAFADIDNDGDQDVLITGYNNNPYEYIAKLYRNLNPVGINENTLFSSVSIFPNPNTGLINIDLGSLSDVSIKVQNVSGRLIYYKENINSPIYQFELDAAPGIYILELSAKGEKQQFKLIKQ